MCLRATDDFPRGNQSSIVFSIKPCFCLAFRVFVSSSNAADSDQRWVMAEGVWVKRCEDVMHTQRVSVDFHLLRS